MVGVLDVPAHGSTSFVVGFGDHGLVVAPAVEDAKDRHGLIEDSERDDDTLLVADRA